MIQQVVVLVLLAICAKHDIQNQRLHVNVILFFGIIGILLHMIFRRQTIADMLLGMFIGAALILVSKWTGGKLGLGDGLLLTVVGIYLGFEENLVLLFLGSTLCALWALYLVAVKKKSKEDRIAFVPFLLTAYMAMLVMV
ncbi:MAG: prepilin peptidase [bacterium]|nr:prepilin peptidase [bacterium]